ncbi:MAG TPA: class II aldolase/adducin family protein [Steroidobacteraceae bacterium]|nr:class II aldolase/adducin family protein [Steroidobacteraceae bacterium]
MPLIRRYLHRYAKAGSAAEVVLLSKTRTETPGESQMTGLQAHLEDLVIANRILAHENVVDGFGHISLRHPERPDRFLMSRSRSPELVTLDDIMEFDLDCNPIDQRGRVMYGERAIHGAIFQARADVNSVVHNHAHEIIPYSVTKTPMRQVIHTAGGMGGHIPVWDIRDDFGDTDMLVRNLQQGRSLAKALGGNAAVLMRGHGVSVVGGSVRDAVRIAVYLMVNAHLQTEAMRLGDVTFLSEGEIVKTAEMSASPLASDRIWEYWARRSGYVSDAGTKA